MESKTATEISMEEMERSRDERMLHDCIEHFVEKWAPRGRDNAEFHADFVRVVQVIHRDASRPFGKMLKKALEANPLSYLMPNDGKG